MILEILGRPWRIDVLTAEQFKKRFDEEAAAYTLPDSNEIVFCDDELCLPTVTHELVHAYFDSLCVSSASLQVDQLEEIFAEMFAIHGKKMLKQANDLYNSLKED